MSEITRVGADLAKRVIQVHAVDASRKSGVRSFIVESPPHSTGFHPTTLHSSHCIASHDWLARALENSNNQPAS